MSSKNLIVIVGPTAVGKTSLAIKIAKHFKTEIVSADSRQFYREMNIGTAKPSASELNEVRHHLINSQSVSDDYNAGRFETDALECIVDIFTRSDFAILCGGSGLYIDLVCNGSDNLPQANPLLRKQLEDLLADKGIQALQEKLKELDPDFYQVIDLNNPHRLIRAIEVCMESGKKYSELRSNIKNKRPFGIIKIGLEDEREIIYKKIDDRVDAMMQMGLLNEVKSLRMAQQYNALRTVGYTELFDYLEERTTLEQAVSLVKQHSRNYAKRQWTWFKKDKDIRWFKPEEVDEMIRLIASKA